LLTPPLIQFVPNKNARQPYPLSWDEQRLLFAALPAHLARMALFKVNTGTREQEVVKLISGHYQTGEPLPAAVLQGLRDSRNFQAALQMVRQLEFSLFDLLLHSDFDPAGNRSILELLAEVRGHGVSLAGRLRPRRRAGLGERGARR